MLQESKMKKVTTVKVINKIKGAAEFGCTFFVGVRMLSFEKVYRARFGEKNEKKVTLKGLTCPYSGQSKKRVTLKGLTCPYRGQNEKKVTLKGLTCPYRPANQEKGNVRRFNCPFSFFCVKLISIYSYPHVDN
jgi:hypothetical protein